MSLRGVCPFFRLTVKFVYSVETNKQKNSQTFFTVYPTSTARLEATSRKTHTWLRAIEADLGFLNFGLATTWRKAAT